jgi:hypothetical protein
LSSRALSSASAGAVDETLDQPLRDRTGEQRFAACDGADRGDELLPAGRP